MHGWARYLFIAVVSVLGIGQMIAACGQKGDLYLPKPEKGVAQKTASGAVAEPVPQAGTGQEPEEESEGAAATK